VRRYALVVAWMAAIFVSSSVPASNIPRHWIFSFDKVLHAGIYAVLGVLVARAARGGGSRLILLGTLVSSLYGATDEFHQRFTEGRNCDPRDWVADTFGGAAGATALSLYRRSAARGKVPS
jgi:VanZ family protein